MALSCRLLPSFIPPVASACSPSVRSWSSLAGGVARKVDPPNVTELAKKARISLTPEEAEDFRPKLEQIVNWFSQLQEVDLEIVAPSLRADADDVSTLRPDAPLQFQKREAMLASVPDLEGPFIKVPKIMKEILE